MVLAATAILSDFHDSSTIKAEPLTFLLMVVERHEAVFLSSEWSKEK
jgi:hypothetical protein